MVSFLTSSDVGESPHPNKQIVQVSSKMAHGLIT